MRLFICLSLVIIFFSCHSNDNTPDVSNISIKLSTKRFEKALFTLDSAHLYKQLDPLIAAYPSFGENFMNTILSCDPRWSADSNTNYVNGFISAYRKLYDTTEKIFEDFSPYEKEIKKGIQLLKYYFPQYKAPETIITYIGPLDGYGDILAEDAIIVGLQHHLGKNATFYQSTWLQETYPKYITDRFEPEYISINCMKNMVIDLYPEKKGDAVLASQMIEKGKVLFFLQKLLPEKKEYLLIGYTEKQLNECYQHENSIWNLFIQNELLQNNDYNIIKNYLGESPKTQELGESSPGNIGAFVGWQIVKKYMSKNPKTTLKELMELNDEVLLEKAKYKP